MSLERFKRRDLIVHYLIILFTTFIYFYIRLTYRQSVFFDFDMPRVVLIVQDFLSNGTFMESQYYMQESVWLNVPWGPMLIFFYSFFLKINSDPLVVANMLTLFHFIGIIFIIKFGWKFFSPTVGVLSGLLMATHPYWVTYSRIIYQPAPIITFIIISMYLLFSVIKENNKVSTALLPISWVVLFQIYIPTYSFIFISLIFLFLNFKKINWTWLSFGILFSILLYLPSVKFYSENKMYLNRVIEAPSLFTPPEKTFKERLEKVALSFIKIPVGGKFEWQTGYSYIDFQKYFGLARSGSNLVSMTFVISLTFVLLSSLWRKINYSKLIVVLWTICPLVSLVVLWVSDLVPRYFLIAMPPASVVIAIFANDLILRYRHITLFKYLIIMLVFLIAIYWTFFNIKYDNFVKNYNYPNGRMPDISETPYIHFKHAMDNLEEISMSDGCSKYVVTNNHINLNYDMWMETRYVWDYIFKNEYINNEENTNCVYVLSYEYAAKELGIVDYDRFGPFVVFKFRNSPNQTY